MHKKIDNHQHDHRYTQQPPNKILPITLLLFCSATPPNRTIASSYRTGASTSTYPPPSRCYPRWIRWWRAQESKSCRRSSRLPACPSSRRLRLCGPLHRYPHQHHAWCCIQLETLRWRRLLRISGSSTASYLFVRICPTLHFNFVFVTLRECAIHVPACHLPRPVAAC
jgi:hypothetical protein